MLAIRNTLKTLKVESNEKGEIMHPIQKKADMAIFYLWFIFFWHYIRINFSLV